MGGEGTKNTIADDNTVVYWSKNFTKRISTHFPGAVFPLLVSRTISLEFDGNLRLFFTEDPPLMSPAQNANARSIASECSCHQ